MTQNLYTIVAPIGNIVAPSGRVNETGLRRFGASISTDPVWKEKFEKDPFDEILDYLKTAGYAVKVV